MDNKTLVGIVMAFVIGAGGMSVLAEDYFVNLDTGVIFECNGGLSKENSNGIQTRCYLETAGKSPYKTSKLGFEPIEEHVEKPVNIIENGFTTDEPINGEYQKCSGKIKRYGTSCTGLTTGKITTMEKLW